MVVHDEDPDDSMMHAADEPTAMWDQESLDQLGLEGAPPPATRPAAGSASSIEVSLGAAEDPHQPVGKPRGWQGTGKSWAITLVSALLLAVVTYYVVRALAG